jgi:hypothetical protein
MGFSFSLVSGRDHRGLMAPHSKPPQSGAQRTGQAKGRRLPLAESGLGSLTGTAAALACHDKGRDRGWIEGGRKLP